MQLEFVSLSSPTVLRANSMVAGSVYQHKGNIVMRVKPTRFILNSTVISDVMNRGDVFVVNLAKGTFYAVHGDDEIVPVNYKMHIQSQSHKE